MKTIKIFIIFFGLTVSIFAQNTDEQLLRAAFIGDIKAVKYALNNGANIEATNHRGWTALIRAANQGYTNIVRLLLDNGANIEAVCGEGTALVHASWHGHTKTVKLLLEHNAKVFTCVMLPTIIFAANNGHKEIVKLFLDAGVYVNIKDEIGGYGGPGLEEQNTEDTELKLTDKEILSLKSTPKTTNTDTTPKIESDKTMHLLPELSYFPTIGLPNHLGGATIIIWASQNGHTDIVHLLLDRGADVNAMGMYGNYALYVATKGNYIDTIRLLVDRGADINQKGTWATTTALICAVKNGSIDIVRLLLERGADVNIKDYDGNTALSIAKKNKNTEIIQILENAGAKK